MTPRLTIPQVLFGLTQVARPIMLETVRPDSCIAMTRVAVEVLDHFGYVTAVPLNVEVAIVNRVFREGMEDGRLQWGRALTDEDVEAGAWGIGLGLESHRQELNVAGRRAGGHVVAVLGKYLVDLSLDQANRPHKGIDLAARIFEFDADVHVGATWSYVLNEGECFVQYNLRPDLETWRDSPDWRQGLKRYRTQIARIIRAIRDMDIPVVDTSNADTG